jgi:YARHG domain
MKRSEYSLKTSHLRSWLALGMLVALSLTAATPAARAGSDGASGTDYYAQLSCAQLWYERNAILARHGYCFQTQRALATFGNVCRPPYGNLPANLNRVVSTIKGWEQKRGCS